MSIKVLRLNKAGIPIAWASWQETATLLVRKQVLWSLGKPIITLHGGYNRAGLRSRLELPSIIACAGRLDGSLFVPALNNRLLFARDAYLCLYCGDRFRADELSRDHVLPVSRGGQNVWTNVVSACRRCNNRKSNLTPEEAGMQLLAIPFVPNRHEYFYLANRDVLADQMAFLRARFSANADQRLV